MKRLLIAIKEFIFELFGMRRIEYFDLLDEYEDYVRGQNLEDKNTLVGTVRTPEQYDLNYSRNFYHIPDYYVEDPEKVEYVALYRSKNLFGNNNTGIVHYGRVISYIHAQRRDIKDLFITKSYDQYYYRFEIAEWKELPNKIHVRETAPRVSLMVNKYLLDNVRFVNELFISNNNEFKLHLGLLDITHGVYDGFFVGNVKIHVSRSRIIVRTPKEKFSYKVRDYKRQPLAMLKKISIIVFDDANR